MKMKFEPEAPPSTCRDDGVTSYSYSNIKELMHDLRSAFKSSQFDIAEDFLLTREAKLVLEKAEVENRLKDKLSRVETELASFKAKCANLEKVRENVDQLWEKVNSAEEREKKTRELNQKLLEKVKNVEGRVRSAEEREKATNEVYEKLLREAKKADAESRKKIEELESAKRRAEEKLEEWKRRYGELEERVSKLETDTVKILQGVNSAARPTRPTILITDSDDDCAPADASSERELSFSSLKRKRSSAKNVNEDEKNDHNVVPGRQDKEQVGAGSGNSNPATVASATNDARNQDFPENHGQGVSGSVAANEAPEARDFLSYDPRGFANEFDEFKVSSSSSASDEEW